MKKLWLKVPVALRDLITRALWTLAQTFVAVWALSDFSIEKSVVIGALGAGLSAAKTFILTFVKSK